ncbi:polysaccharide pyruvyl transferase family protein [Clostridium perfringens]|uniref:polysaccharide pyruvyl transferase family protein n=2 Tax=Clostridium perfringens TaxID=1502 RepID=UPI002ACBEC47|nr:polysaccharide pyruvyl transferase family protein [Clostridium perfringens]
MKIRIEHASNPLNYGTNMMVTNFIYYLNKKRDNLEFVLDVNNESDLENYKSQTGISNITSKNIDYNFLVSNNLFEKIKNKIKREFLFNITSKKNIKKLIDSTDFLIVLGGDDLSEYYGVKSLKREAYKIFKASKFINIYLVGQTIGPFSEKNKYIVKNMLYKTKIYSRDVWTSDYLKKEFNLNNIEDSADLAFLDLPNQNNEYICNEILNKYGLLSNEYICVIPSGLYKSYCDDREKYIDTWIEMINYIREKYKNKKIILFGHVLRDHTVDDRNIIKEIENKINDSENLIFNYDKITPLQARFLLGNGIFTLTGRMHGAISTFQMGKPAISISYSVKYDGIICKGLELKELVVDGKKEEKWKNNNVLANFKESLNYLISNSEEINKKILKNTNEMRKKAHKMIDDISKEIILKENNNE